MEVLTTHLVCSYRPLRRQFHPSAVRPVFDKVRVVRTLCPKEYPEQVFFHATVKVDTDPHEDHSKKFKHPKDLLCEVTNGSFSSSQASSALRCITFEMEIEVSFENPAWTGEKLHYLENKKPSVKAKLFDWPRLDSDQPICDLDFPSDKLATLQPMDTFPLIEVLMRVEQIYKLEKKVVWKYDPLRESYSGDKNKLEQVQTARMVAILAALAEKHHKLKEPQVELLSGDFSQSAMLFSSYWFWKWRVHAFNGINLITKIRKNLLDQEMRIEFVARIRPILMLLRDILARFHECYIGRLEGLEISESQKESVKTYTGLLDRVNDLLASDLTDLVEIEKLLKEEPLKLVKEMFNQDSDLLMPKLHTELDEKLDSAVKTRSMWPILPSPNCIYLYEPHQQVFFSVLLGFLDLARKLRPDSNSIFVMGDHKTLHSGNSTTESSNQNVCHKDLILRSTKYDLEIWQAKSNELSSMTKLKSLSLNSLFVGCQDRKIHIMGSHMLLTALADDDLRLKILTGWLDLKFTDIKDFTDIRNTTSDQVLFKLDQAFPRFECTTQTSFISIVKAENNDTKFAIFSFSIPAGQAEIPCYSHKMLSFSEQTTTGAVELVSAYQTNKGNLLTCVLESKTTDSQTKIVTAVLSAFRVTTESLELSFSTKIELECITTARRGMTARRSARFFKSFGRIFFIFSLSTQKFVMFAMHNGKFCRVSGGKTSDESPVYSFPALASMCESRDRRGHPGNSMYFSRYIKQTRGHRGEYQVLRMRLAL